MNLFFKLLNADKIEALWISLVMLVRKRVLLGGF